MGMRDRNRDGDRERDRESCLGDSAFMVRSVRSSSRVLNQMHGHVWVRHFKIRAATTLGRAPKHTE